MVWFEYYKFLLEFTIIYYLLAFTQNIYQKIHFMVKIVLN